MSGQVGKVGMGPDSAGDSVVLTSVRAHFCSNLIFLMIALQSDYPTQNGMLNFCQFPSVHGDCCWVLPYGMTAERPPESEKTLYASTPAK